jgi:hypothetical protein
VDRDNKVLASAEPYDPSASPRTYRRADGFVAGAAYGMLGAAGALLGVLGSLYQGGAVGPVPVAAVGLGLLNFGVFRLAGWAMSSRLGAAIPAAAWLVVVFVLASKRTEGDLVIQASTASYVFLIGGTAAAAAAIARTRSPRNWLTGQPGLDRLD